MPAAALHDTSRAAAPGSAGGDCVEVADGLSETVVPVRDSKVPHGSALCFEATASGGFHRRVEARRPLSLSPPGSGHRPRSGLTGPLSPRARQATDLPKEPGERTTRPPTLPGRTARVTRPSDRLAGVGCGRLRSPRQQHTDFGPRRDGNPERGPDRSRRKQLPDG
ncbi:DUF397 domain-containing protein [Streptomyces sp. NPDC005303]|uniref:DUF397 domain-containing protein n=1 Tax=Streptomyces sp. NPDC005303 TaxID=3155713 RepID=UPI0033A89187